MTFAISNQVVLSREPEGPLARHIASFADSLDAMGYAAGSIHRQVQICACFSQWLGQREVTPQDITPGHLMRYLRYRARRCRPCLGDAAALMHVVDFLRGKGVISPERVLFPSAKGERLSVHGVQYLLNKHRLTASSACPSLRQKRVTVHRLRHTMAMDLLQSGVRRSVIALWLGHERVETTQIYLDASLAMKEQALAKTTTLLGTPGRYRPGDRLMKFLNGL